MEATLAIDIVFTSAARAGDLPMLQKIAEVFKNGEGPGKIPYAKLKTPEGYNALHTAAVAGKLAVCRFLIEKFNLDINATVDCTGETPLFLSIKNGHQHTTIFLIDNGADVLKRNTLGETPLHYAAKQGTKEIVKLLLSKGAHLNAISDLGMPLHAAARCGNHDVLKYLLELNADPNPTISSYGMSPLFTSLNARSIECMELLLKAGANPNCPCYLVTPIRFAASVLDVGIVKCLLEAGADPNIPDYVGHTPLEHAALLGRQDVVELLFSVTSRISCYPNWSISELMGHAESKRRSLLIVDSVRVQM